MINIQRHIPTHWHQKQILKPCDNDGGTLSLGALHLPLHHWAHVHHHPGLGEIWLYWSREIFMTSFAIVKKSIVRCTSIHQRALQGHTIIIIIKEKGGRPMKIPTCLIGDCHCSDRADREVSSSRQLLLRHSSLLRENTFHNIDTLFQIFKIWGFCLFLAENDPESGYLIFVTGARLNFFWLV